MARLARVVCPSIPHHVTQRGNRRQEVFHSQQDCLEFIDLLRSNGKNAGLNIWAWVLMTSHFHLIVVPDHKDSLAIAMRDSLSDYALSFNRRYGFNGHLGKLVFTPRPSIRIISGMPYATSIGIPCGPAWLPPPRYIPGRARRFIVDCVPTIHSYRWPLL